MIYFGKFYLDKEKDIIVTLQKDLDHLFYRIETPYHSSGNLLYNLSRIADLPLTTENDRYVIEDEIPCFITSENKEVWLLRFKGMEIAEIGADGEIRVEATIPAVTKILMSQTKEYKRDVSDTIVRTFINKEYKFRTDLHTHMNANLSPDQLMALGLFHQIRYPLYYIKKLNLKLTDAQWDAVLKERKEVEKQYADSPLQGKFKDRRIDDNTFINFADLIFNNPIDQEENIARIRVSLSILKDGQAVFTNLEKVYLYRYVFTKGVSSRSRIGSYNLSSITDKDVRGYLHQMIIDSENVKYKGFSLFQNKLLWIARNYRNKGIEYVEITDTTLVKRSGAIAMLKEVHNAMPAIRKETGVMIRFLAGIRRIPLTLVKDNLPDLHYLQENIAVLKAIAPDPYVAGFDIIGEEINDIEELKDVFKDLMAICNEVPGFVARIHAGENDALRSNVSRSIDMVLKNLAPNQPVPPIRIGHGLYTANLNTVRGKELMKKIKDNGVILEFQMTSNVRLNNLNSFRDHPLKTYLANGIRCVQGSDGCALYGSDPIEEQLALNTLLNLNGEELEKMRQCERETIFFSRNNFNDKRHATYELSLRTSIFEEYEKEMEKQLENIKIRPGKNKKLSAAEALESKYRPFPETKIPVILVGGSFNTSGRHTNMHANDLSLVHQLAYQLDPSRFFFVIGHGFTSYEKELYDLTKDRFEVYAIVPSLLEKKEIETFRNAQLYIHTSIESTAAGTYKSFNYEIFERRPSVVIGLDGNSAALNLIQEAKNGKSKALILVSENNRNLKEKAENLQGYVHPLTDGDTLLNEIESFAAKY